MPTLTVKPSSEKIVSLIVFSILFGFAVNLNGGSETLVAKFLDDLTNVMLKFVKIVTYYAPIAFFAIFFDFDGALEFRRFLYEQRSRTGMQASLILHNKVFFDHFQIPPVKFPSN